MPPGLGMGFELNQSQQLNREQRLTLRQLVRLSLELRNDSPEYIHALKGVEGIKHADIILKRKNLKGVLIGGLSEVVWNPRRRRKDFDSHKDVDVAVLNSNDPITIERLEGGIDWWLPHTERLSLRSDISTALIDREFWENAYGVRLSFGIVVDSVKNLESGLYIPHRNFVVDMRVAESLARIDESVTADIDVEEEFRQKLEKRIKDEMSPVVKSNLENCPKDVNGFNLRIKYFSKEEYTAINNSHFVTKG